VRAFPEAELVADAARQLATRGRGAEILHDGVGIPVELGRSRRHRRAGLGGARPRGRAAGRVGGAHAHERRVAELVAQGLQTKEVAARLFVSPKTVEGHLSHIYGKLGLASRTELAHRLGHADPS
jgi:DNA-binding NarL/FixJ family response regulator